MFKKILVYVVCLVIGICLGEVIKHEVFPNTISTIPSGSSTETSSSVVDSSTVAPDSNVWNFIQQFNAINTDTTCSIRHIINDYCGGYELGHYTKIYVVCESLINYSFPQNIDIFTKRYTRTEPIVKDTTGKAVYTMTTYSNEHCVPNPEKN